MIRCLTRIAPLVVVALLLSPAAALAGPPLLCHPFDIGDAQSLPWDGRAGWWGGRNDYNTASLVADTQRLLTSSTPVIVRMETLRRAAIYATRSEASAKALSNVLTSRAAAAQSDALAAFDAGYFVETLRQISQLKGEHQYASAAAHAQAALGHADGYALVIRSLALRPADPAMEFAAALIARSNRHAAFDGHRTRARRGVSQDTLLAKNIQQLS